VSQTESAETSVEDAVEAQLDIVSAADAMMLDSDSADEERWRGWGRRRRSSAPRYSAPRAPARRYTAPRRPQRTAAQVAAKAAKMAKRMAAKMAKKMARKAARAAKKAARKAKAAAKKVAKKVKKVVKKVVKKLSYRARRAFDVPKLKIHFKLSKNLVIPPAMFRRKFKSMAQLRAQARVASYKSQKKMAAKKLRKAKKSVANALKKAGYTLSVAIKNVRSCKKSKSKVCKALKAKLAAMKKLHIAFTAGAKHELSLVQSDYNDFVHDLNEQLTRAAQELAEITSGKKVAKKSASKKKLQKAKSLVEAMRAKLAKMSHQLKVAQVANAELTEQVANIKSAHLKELALAGKMHLTLDEANVIIAKLLRRVRNPPMVSDKKKKD
jgi:hypothetical protein